MTHLWLPSKLYKWTTKPQIPRTENIPRPFETSFPQKEQDHTKAMADDYVLNVPTHWGFTFTPTIHHAAQPALDPRKVKLPTPCSVLITGAGRGLGAAHAIAFAQAGASDIILAARTAAQLEAVRAKVLDVNPAVKVSTFACDITVEAEVRALAQHVGKEHGRLDVLDNNAGVVDHGWQAITDVPAGGNRLLRPSFGSPSGTRAWPARRRAPGVCIMKRL